MNNMQTYQNLCTQFYELDKPAAPQDELNFYLSYAKEAHGPIFEPMCGTGRFLIPILEQGLDIEGADASEFMLNVCKEKCSLRNLHPKLYHQFLQEMNFDNKFSLIFIPSGSFGLITDIVEVKNCLKVLFEHLAAKGKLVFEIETLHAIPDNLNDSSQRIANKSEDEKIILTCSSSYHQANQILQTHCLYELMQDNQKMQEETENFKIRLYQENEMDGLLTEVGFKQIRSYGDYDKNPSSKNDELIIYECTK